MEFLEDAKYYAHHEEIPWIRLCINWVNSVEMQHGDVHNAGAEQA
jgi:hypothetical protein